MKVAVIGSRNIHIENLGQYLPAETTEIISGGAKGVDICARKYAREAGIALKEFLPEYNRYKRGAPLRRNLLIVEYADFILAFWDGKSKGTKHVIDTCGKKHKKIKVIIVE